MGRIDDKKGVFTEIGALTSVKDNFNLPDATSSLSSANNSKEIIPFMLDMLTVLVGSQALEQTVGEVMTGFIRNVEPELKTELKKQTIEYNSNDTLPAGFAAGYSVKAKDIDSYGKLKTDPNTQTGSLLYNNDQNDFDVKSYEAIKNPNTDITFNNMTIRYEEANDQFIYKPVNSSQTIGAFTNDYITGLKIIDEKQFVANVTNNIFGAVSSQQNKTIQQTILEEKINATLQKIIDQESDITISDDELREIEYAAEKRAMGVQTVDVGCSVLITEVSIDDIENLISNTTGSTDPLFVGQQYSRLINNAYTGSRATKNNQAIRDGFFKKLINTIVAALVAAVTAPPQIRALLAITGGFKNNNIPSIGNPVDDLQNKRKLISCISESARKTINEFIFNLVKKQLILLIIPVSKIILKEKINQFLGILKSLTSFTT